VSARAPRQLLVFAFSSSGGGFEGRVGGALERAESGGALRIVRALFVGRDAGSGELAATDLRGGPGGIIAPLLNFRLDPNARAKATARALAEREGEVPGEILSELGAHLEPGEAIVALLVEHVWAAALAEAVARSGGHTLADETTGAGESADLGRRVLAISSRRRDRPAAPAGRDC
jgi:hypothetical protein